jgi:hypothetical protein
VELILLRLLIMQLSLLQKRAAAQTVAARPARSGFYAYCGVCSCSSLRKRETTRAVAAHTVAARAARTTDPALVASALVAAEQACSCSSLRKKALARTVVTCTVSARTARFKAKTAAARESP